MDEKILILLITLFLLFVLMNKVLAQQVPVVENRSIILAKVQCVILKNKENLEVVFQVLESKGVEGYRNLARIGDLILAVPFKYLKNEELELILSLKPMDLVEGELEFVGDEYGRRWIIRRIEKYIDMEILKDVVRSFLISKRYIKEDDEFSYKIEKLNDNLRLIVSLKGNEIINLIMNKDLVIIDYF